MFWVHDKFKNDLDDLEGPGQPENPYGPVVPVKFVDSTWLGSSCWPDLAPLGHQACPVHLVC